MSNTTLRRARRRRRRPVPSRTLATTSPGKVTDVTVPVGALSIYDPIHLGTDENGMPVAVTLAYRNLLAGGEPGAGKSSVLNLIVGHGALSPDCRLWLFDGKRVELGPWRDVADVFVGSDTDHAISKLRELQAEMEIRYAMLEAVGRRKITRNDPLDVILVIIDELAYFTVTIGTETQQQEVRTLVRDLVARGRAAGIILSRHHPHVAAGSVRVPDGVSVHHRLQLGHHPRARLGRSGLHRSVD
jgi:hypothetical protein